MTVSTNWIPDGHPTVTPYLVAKGAVEAMDYYIRLFGGEEVLRMTCPETGTLMHGEIRIGNSLVYLSEACPEYGNHAPGEVPSPVLISIYVPDVDATHAAAVESGATSLTAPADMFWGDRFAKLRDPFGHLWTLSTHKEDLTDEQIAERMKAAFAEPCPEPSAN